MLIKNDKGFYELSTFRKYDDLVHGFSTVEFGNLKGNTGEAVGNRERFFKKLGIKIGQVISAEQPHDGKVGIVDRKNLDEKIAGVDGLVAGEKNLFLAIFVADCLPILAFDPVKQIVGIAHAGWRGTLAEISLNLIKTFQKLGSKPADIQVGFGPAIEFCHYQVGGNRVRKFEKAGLQKAILKSVAGKFYLDLKQANIEQLISIGVPRDNVDVSLKTCTYEIGDFYSARRGDFDNRIAAVIGLSAR